jgi:protein-S-isoprenylcysteine O-methyltransferase Ste14
MFWLIIAVLIWGTAHSLLAADRVKKAVQEKAGGRVWRYYRMLYNGFACLSFLPVLVLAFLTPDRTIYLVPLPWSLLLGLGMLACVVILAIAFLQTDVREFIGLKASPGPLEARQGQLVTGGIYRYVRHPLYSAGLLFIWLMPLMTRNVLAINLAFTVYVIAGAILEERKLRRQFGQAYEQYSARTPMFIPFLKGNKK